VEVKFWEKIEILENEKLVVVEEGKENKKKEKEKKLKREDIFSNLKNENIENTDSRVKVKYAENISENTEIVRNSSISDRLVNFTKNQE